MTLLTVAYRVIEDRRGARKREEGKEREKERRGGGVGEKDRKREEGSVFSICKTWKQLEGDHNRV